MAGGTVPVWSSFGATCAGELISMPGIDVSGVLAGEAAGGATREGDMSMPGIAAPAPGDHRQHRIDQKCA